MFDLKNYNFSFGSHNEKNVIWVQFPNDLKLKGYSNNTVKKYISEFVQLLYVLKKVNVDTLQPERLRSYMLYCSQKLKLSENSLHSRINALKFYFEQVLKHDKLF